MHRFALKFFSCLTFFVSVHMCFLAFAEEKAGTTFKTARFAGGCFWCMQPPYDALKARGVVSTSVGYMGGKLENPTYQQVSAGGTGHREVLQVTYDPAKISFRELVEVFWKNVDPFDPLGQFCDKGEQYTSAIYYSSSEELEVINKSKSELIKQDSRFGKSSVVVLAASKFYPAEDYHQNYYLKNPVRYKYYRYRCGRDARLKEIWGGASKDKKEH